MTFLQHVGGVFKKILGISQIVGKDAVIAARYAEPFVDIAFPEVAPLYNSAVGLAVGAEAMAPTLSGTGPQKLEQLTISLVPQALAWAQQNGIAWDQAGVQKWASAVVDTINMIPAPSVPAVIK